MDNVHSRNTFPTRKSESCFRMLVSKKCMPPTLRSMSRNYSFLNSLSGIVIPKTRILFMIFINKKNRTLRFRRLFPIEKPISAPKLQSEQSIGVINTKLEPGTKIRMYEKSRDFYRSPIWIFSIISFHACPA